MDLERDYVQFVLKLVIDSLTIFTAWFSAYVLRFYVIPGGVGEPLRQFAILFPVVWALFLFFLNKNRLYHTSVTITWQAEIQMLLFSSVQVFLALTVVLYFLVADRVSRLTIALFIIIVSLLLVIERVAINRRLTTMKVNGILTKSVLLVGYGENLNRYVQETMKHPQNGIRIVGQCNAMGKGNDGCTQMEGDLLTIIERVSPDMIVIGYPTSERTVEREVIAQCYDLIQRVFVLPDLPFSMIGSRIHDFHSVPVMQLNDVSMTFFQRVGKRLFEFIVSLIGMVIISPLLLAIALAVKLTSKGPVLFKQRRVTMHGREFMMLKFRSMADRPLGDEDDRWTSKGDPRITAVGKFLRMTSLDELPQLFNVLKGDMSLIGPRPERPHLVRKFSAEIPGYQLRHKVKAGITGWAQVNGYRGDTSLEGRIEYDLAYIRSWSFLLDLKIIVLTFVRGFINQNAY